MKVPIVAYVISLELLVLAGAYFFAPWGLAADQSLVRVVRDLKVQLENAERRDQLFRSRIERWYEDEEFSIEKVARERLHMIKPGDIVYRIGL